MTISLMTQCVDIFARQPGIPDSSTHGSKSDTSDSDLARSTALTKTGLAILYERVTHRIPFRGCLSPFKDVAANCVSYHAYVDAELDRTGIAHSSCGVTMMCHSARISLA
jgi:hypothetical protein